MLGTLGAGEPVRNKAGSGHTRLFYRHEGSTFCVSEPINGEEATFANGGTIGFKCNSPEKVREFHDTEKWPRKTEQWNKWKLWASRWTEDGLASRS